MFTINIVYRKVSEVIPYINNPRDNEAAVEKVAASIAEFGFNVPLVLDKDNVIITGHTRHKAAKKLGLEKIPCIYAEGLTKAQIKAYRIADNKVSEFAKWDNDLLALEMEQLKELDFDMELTGFDIDDIESLLSVEEETGEPHEDDYEVELPKEPKAKIGDIYQLGNHRLMCGDSTKIEDVERLMNGNKADMVFTDPPYNVAFNGRSGEFDVIKNDNLSENEFNKFIHDVTNIIKTINPPIYYIWCNWKFYGVLQEKMNYKSCIVWAKNVFGMGKGYRHQHEFCLFNGSIDEGINNESDLWEVKKDSNYVHPTQKPIELSFRALSNHKNAMNILDLFGGSGSTLIGCEQANRKCYMMELDARYVDVIIDRWEQYTGKEAVLLNANENIETV